MKKALMLAMVLALLMSGCAMQKHCYYFPSLNEAKTVKAGDIMILKYDCFGRVTVNECTTSVELYYLGTTGTYIRMGQRSGVRGYMVESAGSGGFEQYHFQAFLGVHSITEFTYPMDSKLIDLQGTQFEVIKIGGTSITIKLIGISTFRCNKVNGQEVK